MSKFCGHHVRLPAISPTPRQLKPSARRMAHPGRDPQKVKPGDEPSFHVCGAKQFNQSGQDSTKEREKWPSNRTEMLGVICRATDL